ncbi:hypothetical protein MP1_20 [Kurthia phage vb_KgiM_P1]|nr:hypothetical protein MP1_20 [Kurthia phage vb_KgiM_P1]
MNPIKKYFTIPVFSDLENLNINKVTYHDLIIQNNYYETMQAINYMDILISNYNFDLKIRLEVLKDFGENNRYAYEFIDTLLATYNVNNYSIKDLTSIIENEIEEYREKIIIEHHNFLKEVK